MLLTDDLPTRLLSDSADCALALSDDLRVRALARGRASAAPLDLAMATPLQATSGVRIGFHKDTQFRFSRFRWPQR